MKKSLLAAAVFTAFIAQAELVEPIKIENALGVDKSMDYTLLTEMGPWDDRNYQLTIKDLSVLPFADQALENVPVFFKVQYRKEHPETGKHYPRSLYQNFLGNYGGLLVDGVWYKEGLGLGTFPDDTYGVTPQAAQIKAASNEVAIEAGVLGDESAIECNPTNKNNCVAGTNTQNGQTMYYSSDAGASWTKSQTNPNSSCCDPTVDWSSDGSIVYQGDLKRSGSNIGVRWSRSLDQGHTWESMKNITSSGSDKEFIHVDRSPSSAHQDNVYMTWHDGNVLQFARSTDLGLTFSTPLSFTAEPRGIGSDITTDSSGNVYYFYPSTNSNSGIRMLKSTNGGASFAASTRVAVLNGSFDIAIPAMETRRAFIYTSADVDRSNDTIYVAWTDEENDSAGGSSASANHIWINVSKSTNGGASWTSCAIPHDTSDSIAAGNAEDRFHPWIKVGNDGTVHIGYYDTRHSANRTGVDFYYSTSTDACNSWTESRFTTQTSANLTDGQEWGDYNGLSVVLDKIAMTWTDNRSSKATFAGVATIGGTPPPGNNAPTASFTSSCTDLSCSFNGSASSDSDGTISSYSWSFGASGVTASNTFANAGTFAVTLTVTDNNGATGSQTQNITVTAPPGSNTLTNGVPVTGLADSKDGQKNFTMDVPAGATNLTFNMSGGTGDADLYVKFGSAPTLSSYDCRPFIGGNTENCPITNAQTGTYHVMIVAFSTYSGVSLTGSYSTSVPNNPPTAAFTSSCTDLTCSFNGTGSSDSDGTISSYSWSFGGTGATASNTFASAGTFNVTLTVTDNDGATDTVTNSVTVTAPPPPPPPTGNELANGVARTGLSGSTGNEQNFTMVVPAGATGLSFAMSGGTGDADLYVRFGSAPTTSTYDCRPYLNGNNETCNIATAQAGTYHIMIRAFSTYSGVSLVGNYTAGGGGGGQQSVFTNNSNVNIPDNNSTGATSSINVIRTGASNSVKITYSIVHTYRGDLTVQLIDTNGTTTTLRSPSGGSANDINESKTVNKGSVSAGGTWKLKVIDGAGADTGFIDSWSIEFL
jgi:PKD repeat protein